MNQRKPTSRSTGRVTIDDVARHAGVSAITVSRALREPERVSEELRARIERAVAELGYVPNRAARTLASRRSNTVAVLVPSLSNAVFVDVLAGIHEVLAPRGYQLLIGNTRYSEAEEENLVLAYLEHGPDGVLLTGHQQSACARARLAASGVPTVHMMDLAPGSGAPSVGFSQPEAGYAMTRYLLGKGYRRIGFIAAQLDERTLKRREGYRRALAEAGYAEPYAEISVPTATTVGLGTELLPALLAQDATIDAVFCCNDDLALGALFHCQRHGIAVPKRLAIAGFNDLDFAAWSTPALTTIATPRHAIGARAAQLLLARIEGAALPVDSLDLGFELRARESA